MTGADQALRNACCCCCCCLLFLWLYWSIWMFPGQGLNPSRGCDLCHSFGNTRSLTPHTSAMTRATAGTMPQIPKPLPHRRTPMTTFLSVSFPRIPNSTDVNPVLINTGVLYSAFTGNPVLSSAPVLIHRQWPHRQEQRPLIKECDNPTVLCPFHRVHPRSRNLLIQLHLFY